MQRRWFTRMITALPFALRARPAWSVSSPAGFKIPPGFTVKWDVGRDDSEICGVLPRLLPIKPRWPRPPDHEREATTRKLQIDREGPVGRIRARRP